MKKLLLFSGLLIAGLAVNAQTAAKNQTAATQQAQSEDPVAKTNKQTERMAQALNLTPDQKTKAYNILLEKNKQMEASKQKNGTNQQAFEDERKVIRTERDKELKAILTADQQAKWLQLKKDQRANKGAQDDK